MVHGVRLEGGRRTSCGPSSFFAGLEPVPPGVVPVPLWRAGPAAEGAAGAPRPIGRHGGLGRKP
ncbi:hypothetical protein [Streptomyces sp. BBFR115]|uniref:hypothetical protein n=1 Tax=Streptomyces sp. BBFR115 TaxID=3448173 RepID=UPI003F76624F